MMLQAFSCVEAQRPAERAAISQRTTLGRSGESGRICKNASSTIAVERVSLFIVW
jgi:hypothetical protein